MSAATELVNTHLIPVTKWPAGHDWPSVQGLRWIYFKRNQNGAAAAGVFVKAAGRVLVNEARFYAWVEAQNQADAPCK